MKKFLCIALFLAAFGTSLISATAQSNEVATVIVVAGAGGEDEYDKTFAKWAKLWEAACQRAGAKEITLGVSTNSASDHDRLKEIFTNEPKNGGELWLVLLGHGTFDGKEAKFNLRGPDLAAAELATWLKPFKRPLAIINCASASGPFLKALSATNRVVITATKSGFEQNYARFGEYFSDAISNPASDLDKDGQVSLLEAFLSASVSAAEFFKTENRLATEHALIDDNGDGLGTPADFFRGIRAIKKPEGSGAIDGVRAHQFHLLRSEQEKNLSAAARAKRDELELKMAKLREQKSELGEETYFKELEKIALELAHVYGDEQKK